MRMKPHNTPGALMCMYMCVKDKRDNKSNDGEEKKKTQQTQQRWKQGNEHVESHKVIE